MRFLPLFFFLFFPFCFISFSQETPEDFDHTKIRRYVPLHNVLEKGIKLTRADSLEFHFSKGDTMVLVTRALETYFPEGIKVKIEPQDSLFIEKYKANVYGPANRNDRNKKSIKIWKDGIRLYFDPSVPKKHQRKLLGFAKSLASEVDSLSIKKVSERDDANYMVFYRNNADDFDLEPNIVNPQTGYYMYWKNSYFTRASLKVNAFTYENEQQILMDLKQRFFETLGYFHRTGRNSCGSLLSVCEEEEKELTKEDLELLKYHYSYQNCIGIRLKEFECQHENRRKLFAEHSNVRMFVSHPKE